MKAVVLLLCILSFLFSTEERYLKVYNFNEYIAPELLRKFSLENNVKIRYEIYENNMQIYEKLKNGNKEEYDIVVPSGNFVDKMAREGLIVPLDKNKIKNMANIDKNMLNQPFDPNNRYSMPYFWYTIGITYDKTKLPNIKSWNDFWNPNLKDSIIIGSEPREVFAVALKSMGYSANTTNKKEVEAAYNKLLLLIPNIKKVSSDNVIAQFMQNSYKIGMTFSGDGKSIVEQKKYYSFCNPIEGSIKMIDNLVIAKGGKNHDIAHKFIDFLLDAKNSAQNATTVGYALPNSAAMKLLSAKERSNKITYPDAKSLSKSETLIDLKDVNNIYDEYWEKFLKKFNEKQLHSK